IINATVSSGGNAIISAGAVGNMGAVQFGGQETVFGTVDHVTVGGTLTLLSGGDSIFDTVVSGGALNVSSGPSVDGTTNSRGGTETGCAEGKGSDSPFLSAGFENVFGTASSTTISAGGSETVVGGGVTSAVRVSSGGTLNVSSGGSAQFVVVFNGG